MLTPCYRYFLSLSFFLSLLGYHHVDAICRPALSILIFIAMNITFTPLDIDADTPRERHACCRYAIADADTLMPLFSF